MSPRRILLPVLALSVLSACPPTYYSRLIVEKLRVLLGSEFQHYKFFNYPTNNFGAGTAYATAEDAKSGASICAMASCLDVSPTDFEGWLDLGGFLDVGRDGPILALSVSEQTKLNSELDLPKIAQLVDLDGGFDFSKGVKWNVSLGRAYPRRLNREKATAHIAALSDASLLKKAYNAGTLVLVTNDVVVDELSVEVCVASNANAGLEVKLSEAMGKVLGRGAKLAVKVDRSSTGCYLLHAEKPVIVAVMTRRQPQAGVLAGLTDEFDWSGWSKEAPLPEPFSLK